MLHQLAVSIGQRSSIVGDDEISQLPGILISLDLDLLRLFVHLQFACRQHRAGTLSVGREAQPDAAEAIAPESRTRVQFAEANVAIGTKPKPPPAREGQSNEA